MSEVQQLLDFPPAPGLGINGKLNPRKFAAESPEMKGQNLFFGKAQCATCHPAPYYTDNLMHDLQVDRFYKTQTITGMVATKQGPIKTFSLRGIKESPPYFHDGRLLTLEDRGVLQSRHGDEAHGRGEEELGRISAPALSRIERRAATKAVQAEPKTNRPIRCVSCTPVARTVCCPERRVLPGIGAFPRRSSAKRWLRRSRAR
jgi:hypothetical protein